MTILQWIQTFLLVVVVLGIIMFVMYRILYIRDKEKKHELN